MTLPCHLPTVLHHMHWFVYEVGKSNGWLTFLVLILVVVQLLSCIWLFAIPWTTASQAPLSSIISWSLLKFTSIELVTLSNHLILCHPPLLLPSIFLSIRTFSNELAFHIKWPKYWGFSFNISPSNEYSRLIYKSYNWWVWLPLYCLL